MLNATKKYVVVFLLIFSYIYIKERWRKMLDQIEFDKINLVFYFSIIQKLTNFIILRFENFSFFMMFDSSNILYPKLLDFI